jgi:hypothetical protein
MKDGEMKWTESAINIQSDKAAEINGLRTDLPRNVRYAAVEVSLLHF